MAEESPEQTTTEYTPGPDAIDISEDGGILKEIRKQGCSEASPLAGDEVIVHYVGTLLNGDKFDSSRDRGEHFKFTIGRGQVIKAWDLGVATMKKGEVAILYCKPEYAYGAQGQGKIPPNSTLVFEVELYDWKGEDISPEKDGGILRSKLNIGDGFDSPKDGAQVTANIVGRYEGRVFEDRTVEFTCGEECEGIPQGVDIAIKKMNKGEHSRFVIAPQYAYKSEGNKQFDIPPNAKLEYDIKLDKFEKVKESWEMDLPEKLEQADVLKSKGTNFFKKNNFVMAKKYYEKVLDMLKEPGGDSSDENKGKRTALLVAGNLNAAMCAIKLNENVAAINFCNSALEDDPNNEKALFRRATAKMNVQDFEEATLDFNTLLKIAPENKAAKKQIMVIKQKIKQHKENEKKTFAGMFQKFAEIDAKKEKRDTSEKDVFTKPKDWENEMADGYLPLEQEVEAFGEKMPEPQFNKSKECSDDTKNDDNMKSENDQ